MAFIHKSSARFSLDLLPGFEFLKIKSVLYDTDNTPKNVTEGFLWQKYRKCFKTLTIIHNTTSDGTQSRALPSV